MPSPAAELALERPASKSPLAFRTISEVAEELDVPQHVLRFWESRFPQIKPLKRGGGRRYYRPSDVELLGRVRDLLYREGYTIKGVQKLLREGAGRGREVPVATEELQADQSTPKAEPATAATPVDELRSLLSELTDLRDILRKTMR